MHKPIFICALMGMTVPAISQADTNYTTKVVSVEWMPDGKAILLAAVKFHKTDRQAPFYSKVFRYELQSGQPEPLFENGSNLAPSPTGKTIAFLKRNDDRRADIYFYNMDTKQETLLKTDTTRKYALTWSPDGKKLMYNISYKGVNQYATVDVSVVDLATNEIKQITHSGKDKSYNPVWCPDNKKIVYYVEKGDSHDQIWLTDINGSFHTNLTHDTTTHNYFPCWFDEKMIIYTQSPGTIMTMKADGSNRQQVVAIKSDLVKYNSIARKLVYVTVERDNKVILFDWKKKTTEVLLDETSIGRLMQ